MINATPDKFRQLLAKLESKLTDAAVQKMTFPTNALYGGDGEGSKVTLAQKGADIVEKMANSKEQLHAAVDLLTSLLDVE